ncbi:hypothetical protein SUGI_0808540 [Cryptomeria japonica]|uniref:ABC transporter G family member 11 n=1 Tax=Cryptomeria japonica TaxID=3369 RepID=UPI00241473EF|nr:ABC transporter G family member 11 [Cryptomeria japonica]GLJ39572.1 hypothetical protein SUGI_0808540 [Cryptomeria japonica]
MEIQSTAPPVQASISPLSQTLWKNTANAAEIGSLSAYLTWVDLTVTATDAKGDSKRLLRGLTGYAEPGHIMAVMGPSGSGKSTLIDSLAGRLAKNAVMSGKILVNGRKRKLTYGSAAYVTQEDVLIGTLTVRESIYYSANLRLSNKLSREEKKAIVEDTILEMGLQDCADRPIGNWHLRGISGGEKRRVSIALEILMRPRLLFLDEPTSGLDSASAFFVVEALRNLALDGRTVIASIHQPSSEVFELFDQLCLLSSGQAVYFGDAKMAQEFFAQVGFTCPRNRNPADHFLRCINADFDKVKDVLRGSFRLTEIMDEVAEKDPLLKINSTQAIRILTDAYQSSEYAMIAAAKVHEISQTKGTVIESKGSQASFWVQCIALTTRSFINMTRDIGYYWLRVIIYILVALCVGTIYFDVGTGYTAILARSSCGAFVSGFMTFMSIGGFPSFIEDMKVFHRERLNGHYGVAVFVIANFLSSFPYLVMVAGFSGTIVYYMVKLHPGFIHYAYFILDLFGTIAVVESLMMVVASLVPNFLMGIVTGAGIMGIMMMTSGFFRLLNDLPKPVWRYPISYISYGSWGLQGSYKNDFLGLEFDSLVPGGMKLNGEYIIENVFDLSLNRSKWWDLAIVFLNIAVYRLLFLVILKFNEKITPFIRGLFNKYAVKRLKRMPSLTSQAPPLSAQTQNFSPFRSPFR